MANYKPFKKAKNAFIRHRGRRMAGGGGKGGKGAPPPAPPQLIQAPPPPPPPVAPPAVDPSVASDAAAANNRAVSRARGAALPNLLDPTVSGTPAGSTDKTGG